MNPFKETVRLAREHPWHTIKDGCSVQHLENMLDRIMSAEQTRHPYSSAKLGRHLGWAQAILVVYSTKGYTFEDMKQLNARYAEA